MKRKPDIRRVRRWTVGLAVGVLFAVFLYWLCQEAEMRTARTVFLVLMCLLAAAELFVELRYHRCPHCGEFPGRYGNHCPHCGGLLFEEEKEDDEWNT